ncbi:hypothetical protein NSK_000728 [Nannochloropsis salina CCMP1776]|uniref:BZIP domain-containing protein n=1 Tax=Nannochloropsis salina CCMP1776 TaxID=1027361 RepID=A0A4D9DHS5_9STRA|nr:hypothetical protein NSK_000728 [Nannochloropsis salina CCMP1776]|eukprot:TFJ88379.1 hypothetical protein NSK_000728 [Nannochloropsis salina CCMP1776]
MSTTTMQPQAPTMAAIQQPTSWGILSRNNSSTDLAGEAGGLEAPDQIKQEAAAPLWTAPLYASANNSNSMADTVDLDEIFADDFLLPGMGMVPFGTEGDMGPEDMFPGGLSCDTSVATNDNDDSAVASGMHGKGKGAQFANAAPQGKTDDKTNVRAAAVVRSAASRTRSGITTRLGLNKGQGRAVTGASSMLPSAVPSRARAPTRKGSLPVEEEEDVEEEEEEYETGSEEEGEGGDGRGARRRKKAKLTLKPLTEAQRVERRERNREHAKRSRMRKKFMLESLQAQMLALRKENLRLRQLVATKLPDKADTILRGCSSIKTQNLLSSVELGHHRALADHDGRLVSALQFAQQNFTVSDPSLPDNPIIYASQGFLDLTGYTSDQIVGRNCRFLQGPGTDPAAVDIIRRGVALGEDTSVCLLNYRADGTPFWNQFFVAALRDMEGNIVNYVGVQCKVEEAPMEEELKERVKTINFDEEE